MKIFRNNLSIKSNSYVILALCVALLAGCGGKTPKLGKLAPADVIVAFGDSLTFGTGASEAESYPIVLGQLIGRKVIRAGVLGEAPRVALRVCRK